MGTAISCTLPPRLRARDRQGGEDRKLGVMARRARDQAARQQAGRMGVQLQSAAGSTHTAGSGHGRQHVHSGRQATSAPARGRQRQEGRKKGRGRPAGAHVLESDLLLGIRPGRLGHALQAGREGQRSRSGGGGARVGWVREASGHWCKHGEGAPDWVADRCRQHAPLSKPASQPEPLSGSTQGQGRAQLPAGCHAARRCQRQA